MVAVQEMRPFLGSQGISVPADPAAKILPHDPSAEDLFR